MSNRADEQGSAAGLLWATIGLGVLLPTLHGEHGGAGVVYLLTACLAAAAGALVVPAYVTARRLRPEAARAAAALASAAAATIHFSVIAEHVEEWWLFGLFFAVAGLAQLAWALLVLSRPSRQLLLAGIAGNAAIALMWLVSRTAGLPLGPDAGQAEPFGRLDGLAAGFELVAVVAGALLLRSGTIRAGTVRIPRAVWPAAVAVFAMLALVLATSESAHEGMQHSVAGLRILAA